MKNSLLTRRGAADFVIVLSDALDRVQGLAGGLKLIRLFRMLHILRLFRIAGGPTTLTKLQEMTSSLRFVLCMRVGASKSNAA